VQYFSTSNTLPYIDQSQVYWKSGLPHMNSVFGNSTGSLYASFRNGFSKIVLEAGQFQMFENGNHGDKSCNNIAQAFTLIYLGCSYGPLWIFDLNTSAYVRNFSIPGVGILSLDFNEKFPTALFVATTVSVGTFSIQGTNLAPLGKSLIISCTKILNSFVYKPITQHLV
jgi:hypothetical protein